MKTFKSLQEEIHTTLNEASSAHNYHHTSVNMIDQKKHASSMRPMWLSHSAGQAGGWHKNAKDENGSAYTYTAKVNGKIAHHDNHEVKALLHKYKVDQDDYHDVLVTNPEPKEVHNHPATKILKKHGYVGYSHPDYDSRDWEKDHDSTVVFHRKNVILTLKKSN